VTSYATISWCSASTGGLDIVADDSACSPTSSPGSSIGIGQRDLLVRRVTHFLFEPLERLHLRSEGGDLLIRPDRLRLGDFALLPVCRVEDPQVAVDADLELHHKALVDLGKDLAPGEDIITSSRRNAFKRTELSGMNGTQRGHCLSSAPRSPQLRNPDLHRADRY
jgi:hypothetical protein